MGSPGEGSAIDEDIAGLLAKALNESDHTNHAKPTSQLTSQLTTFFEVDLPTHYLFRS